MNGDCPSVECPLENTYHPVHIRQVYSDEGKDSQVTLNPSVRSNPCISHQ